MPLTRRCVIAAGIGAAIYRALPARAQAASPDAPVLQARAALAALETKHGGRLGVVAADTALSRRIAYRPRERFAMCSTHKFLSTAAVLAQVDRGRLSLDRQVPYSRADLLGYAPITKRHVEAGSMTVDALCAAAIEWSDSTAANLLLKLIDGPDGWTHYARSLGDTVSRLDRTEPRLNSAIPGDVRDTTTPDAMVQDLDAVLLGTALSDASRARLEGWMRAGKTTGALLRAGLPNDWTVGDKSGSGDNGTRNDIGIIRPPGRAPILAAVYYTESMEPSESHDRVVAEVGRIVAQTFAT